MWYAAHAIMLFRYRDSEQNEFPVWENIFLVEANGSDEALRMAEERAKKDEFDDETRTYNGKPADIVFVGIRKLMQCLSDEEQPSHGTEVSHNQLRFKGKAALEAYIRGEETVVTFEDENFYEYNEE
jgi:hypothetical protein